MEKKTDLKVEKVIVHFEEALRRTRKYSLSKLNLKIS